MKSWELFQEPKTIFKAMLIGIAILAAGVLLLMPLLTVDADETVSQSINQPGLAFMERAEATGGILLLGSVLVLIIVGGTLRVLNQDRLHRPHLLKKRGEEEAQGKE
jgi:hypothetical protein